MGVEGLLEKNAGRSEGKAGQKNRVMTELEGRRKKAPGSEMPGEKEGQGVEGKGKKVISLLSTYPARNCT